jgi:hypothetical protein
MRTIISPIRETRILPTVSPAAIITATAALD